MTTAIGVMNSNMHVVGGMFKSAERGVGCGLRNVAAVAVQEGSLAVEPWASAASSMERTQAMLRANGANGANGLKRKGFAVRGKRIWTPRY